MKTTNLSVNKEANEVNVTITLPFILPEHAIEDEQTSASDIIAAAHNILIEALHSRQNAYVETLLSHRDDIVYNDGTTIVYDLPDNVTGTFSTAVYAVMSNAIHELKCGNYITFSLNKEMVKQAIKALCEYRQLDGMFYSVTCDDLISALLDCLENDYDLNH